MSRLVGTYLTALFEQAASIPAQKLVLYSILLGINSHLGYFIHGDHDHLSGTFFIGSFLIPSLIFGVFHKHLGIAIIEALTLTATIWTSFLAGLTASIITYRLLFHPLRKFPGPFGAKVTKWWSVVNAAKTLQNHELGMDLHAKYGDFVRTGPNELSINCEAIVPIVIKLAKGPWYNLGKPKPSTQLTRDRDVHRANRRLWDKAFTSDAVMQYLPKLIIRSTELLDIIAAQNPVNISEYFNYYMWDSMGDATFSKSFNMLPTHGKENDYMRITKNATTGLAIFGHVPYLPHILDLIPGTNRDYKGFLRWCDELVNERRTRNPEKKDVFSWLLTADAKTMAGIGMANEARLAILAGSDTTATTLTNICFHLADNQDQLKILREEIDALYSSYQDDEDRIFKDLAMGKCDNTDHLEGVINEVLRLHPVLPSSPQRMAPPEGITIDNTFVPGNTAIYAPMHTIFRDARNFERPKEFLPERWYKTAKYPLTRDQKVFIPFWTGTWSCAGKPLANMHLRIVVTRIVRRFSIQLAAGMNEDKLNKDAQDLFILYMGDVNLILKERNM
ncbi:uncharacterized protein H6S33_009170 [Morchella sextelata]|uniref:uncharacterized protein n=1 Tax=Morchella sextelata TaxID=1174677 RepID=UPI001D046FBC|nr:uncharacterized protein H6S33_009170 [Morchella sextelata]KAH0612790.1 hypothetical protein H6S33_009170 [Morchella sextelata]